MWIAKLFSTFRSFVRRDQHGGHGLEVPHIVPHAKEVLLMAHYEDQAKIGKKSGQNRTEQNRKQCNIRMTLLYALAAQKFSKSEHSKNDKKKLG